MNKEQNELLTRFVQNVQSYHETHNKAKDCTRGGSHVSARSLHNDAQNLGESVVAMIPEVNSILTAAI